MILTPEELAGFRQSLAKESSEVTWQKADINAGAQGLEDWWETTGRNGAASAMETASPGKFTNAQKKIIGKFWLQHKFLGGG